MGLTERHWFEDEEPELTDRQLEDMVYENKKAYDSGYAKGFHDASEQLLKEHPYREKVIRAWEIFRESNPYEICNGREFRAIKEPEYCMGKMIEDTIALLKEQEAVKPIAEEDDTYECICGAIVGWDELDASGIVHTRFNYCPYCGKAVKWE